MTSPSHTPAESTEEKIKRAAKAVFMEKGYAATRTRDIAEAAGENLALINYYFRSKENLYRIVMLETMSTFLQVMIPVFNNPATDLNEKIDLVVVNYIDLFITEPGIPLFVMTEINNGAEQFMEETAIKNLLVNSVFFRQLQEHLEQRASLGIHPVQFFISIIGMVMMPFLAKPMVKGLQGIREEEYLATMEQRKKMIPIWAKAMLNS